MRFTHAAVFVLALTAFAPGCDKKDEKGPAPVASATPSAEKAPEPAKPTFAKKAPTVGQKAEESSKMKMTLSIDVDPGTGKTATSTMESKESESRDEEVLAVSGDAVTKVKVKYGDIDKVQNDGKKDAKTPDARSGKTYIVESKDGKIVVTSEDGKPVVPQEATPIEKDFQLLGKPDPVAAALPARALKPGESVPEVAKAMSELLKASGDKTMDVTDVTATFREQKGDEGIFDVTLTLGKTDGPMKMSIPLKGEMHARTADGQLAGMKLAGPISVVPSGDPKEKAKVSGKGTMEVEATRKSK